jgi:hypothetical protein
MDSVDAACASGLGRNVLGSWLRERAPSVERCFEFISASKMGKSEPLDRAGCSVRRCGGRNNDDPLQSPSSCLCHRQHADALAS